MNGKIVKDQNHINGPTLAIFKEKSILFANHPEKEIHYVEYSMYGIRQYL